MLNSIEEKICDLLNKIYTLLKNKAKSEKNHQIGNLTPIVHMIITCLCNNSTDELFSHLLNNFKEFITSVMITVDFFTSILCFQSVYISKVWPKL